MEATDPFSRIFSTRAFDLDEEDEDNSVSFEEDEYFDEYYNLNNTENTANNAVNSIGDINSVDVSNLNLQSQQPTPSNPPISISIANPSDAVALLNVRLKCLPIPYECRNVPESLYASSLLSRITAELKVSAENPTKNIIIKATRKENGFVVGFCCWGFAGLESRALDDRGKREIRSPQGYDRAWLKRYIATLGDLEEKTFPEGDCIRE